MSKRTPDQLRYSSETNKTIGQKLRDYYQACTTEELSPRLLALVKKFGSILVRVTHGRTPELRPE